MHIRRGRRILVETTTHVDDGGTMKRAIFWGTLAAGVVAAYLMVKRGAPLTEVLTKTLRNPFGALGAEVQGAFASTKPKQLTA